MPIEKLKIGGTEGEELKSEDACNIVPSPPNVAQISTLSCSGDGSISVECGELAVSGNVPG